MFNFILLTALISSKTVWMSRKSWKIDRHFKLCLLFQNLSERTLIIIQNQLKADTKIDNLGMFQSNYFICWTVLEAAKYFQMHFAALLKSRRQVISYFVLHFRLIFFEPRNFSVSCCIVCKFRYFYSELFSHLKFWVLFLYFEIKQSHVFLFSDFQL